MNDDSDDRKKEIERAKWYADREWQDVKYSNDRENNVADLMITSEIQASAIFIALSGAMLASESSLVFLGVVFCVLAIGLFSLSIFLGIFGLYRKELFWREEARKYSLVARELAELWEGHVGTEHVKLAIAGIRNGTTRSQSPNWPIVLQSVLFFLASVSAFVGLLFRLGSPVS